jgi:hypothetical protein
MTNNNSLSQLTDSILLSHVKHELISCGVYQYDKPMSKNFYKPLSDEEIKFLKKYKHMVTFNLNLPTTFIVITQHPKSKTPVVVFVKKDNTYYISRHRFDDKLYMNGGSIFEGELIESSERFFLIHDVVKYLGKKTEGHSLTYRLSQINSLIKHKYTPDKLIEPYQLIAKPYVEYQNMNSLWEVTRNNDPIVKLYKDKIVGITFRPNVTPNNKNNKSVSRARNFTLHLTKPHCHKISDPEYSFVTPKDNKTNTSDNASKHTGDEKHTNNEQIDTDVFIVIPDRNLNKPDVYYLYNPNTYKYKGIATVPSLDESLRLQELFNDIEKCDRFPTLDNSHGYKMTCELIKRFRKYCPREIVY